MGSDEPMAFHARINALPMAWNEPSLEPVLMRRSGTAGGLTGVASQAAAARRSAPTDGQRHLEHRERHVLGMDCVL